MAPARIIEYERHRIYDFLRESQIKYINQKHAITGITLKKISKKKIHFFKNKQKKINVGMLSRIEEYKGQIDLVEGFSRLSEKNKSRFKVF